MNSLGPPQLTVLSELPPGFLDATCATLYRVVPGPTLIHLRGIRADHLFVSILLHGNEDVGLLAVQSLLKRYQRRPLPRALSIFVGNVHAAHWGARRLDNQPDYNRIWPGTDLPPTPEHLIMQEVLDQMRGRRLFASIDLHNNTGINPHYACINLITDQFIQLATLFSRTIVFFQQPRGVQSMAFSKICPSVTCECGRVGAEGGVQHAMDYLDTCLHLTDIPDRPIRSSDANLFHTVATIKVPADVDFSFGTGSGDLCFSNEIDHLNFQQLPAGTPIARRRNDFARLEAWNESGLEAGEEFLETTDTEIRLRRGFMPAMLTRDAQVIRQDCLCYLMERLPLGS